MNNRATTGVGMTLGGRYKLTDKIGEGGFGKIFRARQINVDREVAVKILPSRFNSEQNVVERFRREARLASRLKHPNTITIHAYGQHEDLFYIVMEFLYGEDLADRLSHGGPMAPEQAVKILSQTLRSLKEAHDMGIVHRDLKPENIFLTTMSDELDFVKVLDFGIAKLAEPDPRSSLQEERSLTMDGSTVGTPAYMSPEQAAGEELAATSDLYTAGIILYEMLNGRPPFFHERPIRTMRAHLFDPVPPFARKGLRGSPLEAIVLKALEKEPEQRFQSAREFLDALKNPDLIVVPDPSPTSAPAAVIDQVPFTSVPEPTPPPEGFSLQGSVTSSIITVLEEPEPDEVIVLTERKSTPEEVPATTSPSLPTEPSTEPEIESQTETPSTDDWTWSEDQAVDPHHTVSPAKKRSSSLRLVLLTLLLLLVIVGAYGYFGP